MTSVRTTPLPATRGAPRWRLVVLCWALPVLAALSGCAVNRDSASAAPGADLAEVKRIYVVRAAQDDRGVEAAIVERLRQMGRTASSGPPAAVPDSAQAVLSYQAKWQWDITMYLLELRATLRDARTDALLATATSYHTSLSRKSTDEMVREVLGNLLSGAGSPAPAGGGGGMMGNAAVRLAPYAAPPAAPPRAGAARPSLAVPPVRDDRREAVGALIGERTTIGNVSMGMIELAPQPAQAVADVLRAEFQALGWQVADDAPVRVESRIVRFQVTTPATMLYWDINGTVELELVVRGTDQRRYDARHTVQCTGRTFAWPGEALIAGVVQDCLRSLGAKVRADTGLAAVVEGR